MSEENVTVTTKDASLPEEYVASGIDFSSVHELANTTTTIVPWYRRLGEGLLNSLIKLGLFLLGFLMDIVKALWTLVSGIFIYLYKGVVWVLKYIRQQIRYFCEMDVWGKLTFLFQGVGPAKSGQIVDGIVFFAVEIAFFVFMAVAGVPNIAGIIGDNLSSEKRKSHLHLINGIIAILVILCYLVVYFKGIKAAHDDFQILHSLEFRKAHEDALYVAENPHLFPEVDFDHASRGKIRRIMREKYGYSALSARYISYVDFRLIHKKPNVFVAKSNEIRHKIFEKYASWRDRVKAGVWADAFAAFLNFEFVKHEIRAGREYVVGVQRQKLLSFRHSFDKYNDYHQVVRDSNFRLAALEDPQELLLAAYAEDPVSIRNGIAPVPHETKLKAKELITRIVGRFETPFEVGKALSKTVAKTLNGCANDEQRLAALEALKEKETIFHDEFVRVNRTNAVAEANALERIYTEYRILLEKSQEGGKALATYLAVQGISPFRAKIVISDFKTATKTTSTEEEASALFAKMGKQAASYIALVRDFAYHGKTLTFEKQVKQYADEKFATTILAIPTIGAVLTCIIPLFFSIAIAFTGWNSTVKNYTFNWDMGAWADVFGMGTVGGDFIKTFGTLLLWTIIWAILATFTNYIGGIVLALLINKKGIKGKGFWRTCFVITIAIPQFITLMVVNLLLSDGGPVNTWLEETFHFSIPFLGVIRNGTPLFELDRDASFIKFMIVLINMWVGIPYTMLSTSGILMNIPADLYESAQIDGANPWTQFWKITMPYILFVTGPSLLTTFIGNINNFNVIFFLSNGEPMTADALGNLNAGHTDLLITWLYKLTVSKQNPEYAMGSVIGILVFVVCAFFSLIMYKRMGSVKNEEAFQ